MAVPRPVLLALAGLVLVASVFLVSRQHASSESVTRATVRPAVAQPAPRAATRNRVAHPAAKAKPAAARAHKAQVAPAKPAAPVAPRTAPVRKPAVAAPSEVQAAAAALARDEVVVLFFSKPGAADDTGARAAVHTLRGMRRVQIFDAGLDQVAAFRPMLSNLGISQIPATVIVRPGKKAVLIQGFVDAGTLRQNVADALR